MGHACGAQRSACVDSHGRLLLGGPSWEQCRLSRAGRVSGYQSPVSGLVCVFLTVPKLRPLAAVPILHLCGFLVREACVSVLVGGAVFLLSGVK